MANKKMVRMSDIAPFLRSLASDSTCPIHIAAEIDQIIEQAPTVDAVEVVHAHWIGTQYDGYADGCPVYDLWECSNCQDEYESEGDPPAFNYCPNCGAKMNANNEPVKSCRNCGNDGFDMPQCKECSPANGFAWFRPKEGDL